jgi:probable rRNA maturation factor
MARHDSQLELSIDLGNDDSDTALLQLISSLSLEAVVDQTLHEAGVLQPMMLTLLITNDETIRNLNKQYRGQDKPTDVLSFPLLDKPIVNAPADQLWTLPKATNGESTEVGVTRQVFVTPTELPTNLGDIVISWPTIVRQATEVGHSSTYELLYLLAHGVLHLVGYDDQTEAGYQAMIRIQQAVMDATEQKA